MRIGIDVGGTKILGVVVDELGVIGRQHRTATPRTGGDELLDAIADTVEHLRDDDRPPVGVGVPGLVDATGVLRYAPNIPGVFDVPLRSELERRLDTSVRIDNDANCAGYAEARVGAGQGSDHCIAVTLGTGIGGGLVLRGELLRGAHGFAGEIGHMVVQPDGIRCPCGKRGCWERYASGSGLGRLAREAAEAGEVPRVVDLAGGDAQAVKGEHVTAAAAEGDADAIAVMERFAWWLGLGLANLANIFDPDTFVLGGGLVEAGDVLLAPTRRAYESLVEAVDHRPPVHILPAALGEHAGAIGAALLA